MHSSAPSQHRSTTPGEVVLGAPRKPLILVIEDHELARRALAALLSTMGYEVVEATNCREALMTLATDARPDVILLDLVMPIMDGWEFMKRQRRDWRLCTIPTIVISGVPSHDPRSMVAVGIAIEDAVRSRIDGKVPRHPQGQTNPADGEYAPFLESVRGEMPQGR